MNAGDSASPSDPDAATTILLSPTTTTAVDAFSSRRRLEWPTIDGPLGLCHDDSISYARRFFRLGFLCLPFLWAVNCFYFWPILRDPHSRHSHPDLRRYVVGSAIGFIVFMTILSSWALTFGIGGERVFGHAWEELVMYNVADKYGLTGWI